MSHRKIDPGALTQIVTALAAVIALALTVTIPVAYFLSARVAKHAELAAERKMASATISQLINRNPELWVLENARVRGLLAMLPQPQEPEWRTVFSKSNQLVAEQGTRVLLPVISETAPLYDAGIVVGRVEFQRSERQLLLATAVIAAFAGLLGAVAFIVLRSWPLRLLHRALDRSSHLATHDVLTGLPNRALFHDRVEQELAWCRREGTMLAVLYLDLDRFKEVNDTLGHAAGDQLLIGVSARLRSCLRETDTLARLGGDEFAIIQGGIRQLADSEILAQRLIDVLNQAFELDGYQVTIGVSVGVALRNATELAVTNVNSGVLLREADTALYRSKEDGRGVYRFFAPEMNETLLERRALEMDIVKALELGEFRLHYQPQVDLLEHRIVGAEALIRWNHPVRGEVPPDAFIALAEESGLIIRIGEWVLCEACRQAVQWPSLRRMAVNVSPMQFRRAGFVDQVKDALTRSGLDAARLELEITEGVLLHETEETLGTLRRLHALGVAIAMDDFGTGYSSLGYLQKFPFDKIKIDRSFVKALQTDSHAAEIVRAVLRMSHAMGIRVNAEGVEHESQATILFEEGCEEVQGFLFGRGLAVAEFTALLTRTAQTAMPWVAATA